MNMNSTLIVLCHRYSPIQTPPDEGIDGYTFRGLGHCENQRGSTLSYNTIFGVETIQECGSACEDRYSSNSNFRGINFLPSMLQMQSRRGEPPTWSEPNCNCMMEEGSGGDILSANGINEELCYSWDGPSEVSEHPAFGFRGFEFQGMGCCMNDRGDFFGYETVPANDIFECAETCEETFKYDERFVGINFLLEDDWTNCNCLLSDSGNGKITGSSGKTHLHSEFALLVPDK